MAAQILQPIECSVQPLDVAFHPSQDILAAALVDGTVECKIFKKGIHISWIEKKENESSLNVWGSQI